MKRLAFIPLIGAVLVLLGIALEPAVLSPYHRAILVISLVLTGFSGLVTASRFSRGDRLLLSWALVGAGYLFSAIRHGVRMAAYFDSSIVLPPAMNSALAIAQNVAIALALLLFVLAWRATGLTAPVSRGAQILSTLAGIAVAAIVGGYPLLKALGGSGTDPIMLVSTAGDIIGLSLIVPLALSALAMRGGLLMHTWVYLAASELAWLFYDLIWSMLPSTPSTTDTSILEAMRITAVLFAFAATMAQRRAMR